MFKKIREHRGICSIPEFIKNAAKDFKKQIALTGYNHLTKTHYDFTYEDLWRWIKAVAWGLKKVGVKPKDHIALIGPNSPEWGIAYLSILGSSAICIPIDSQLKSHEIYYILKASKAKYIFVHPKFFETILELDEVYGFFKKIFLFGGEIQNISMSKVISLSKLYELGKKYERPLKFPYVDEVAVILYTSGTTGKAKGVMLTHRNLVSDVAIIYQCIELGPGDVFLSVLPMHHAFEGTAGFLLPLYSGARVVYARSLKSKEIIEDLKKFKVTIMLGVPLLYQKMWEGIEREIKRLPRVQRLFIKTFLKAVDLGRHFKQEEKLARTFFQKLRQRAGFDCLRFFVSGGAPLPPHIFRNFKKIGVTILQGYGLTETSPVVSVNPPDAPKAESSGWCLPEIEVKVHNPGEDGVGELCFRGPVIMKGYYDLPELTKETIDSEGFLHTGDLGYVDRDGYIYICGRKKNIIVTPAGKNVYPEEIESLLDQSPYILESLVFGIPTRKGEEVGAVIVPDYDAIERQFPEKSLDPEFIKSLIQKEIKKQTASIANFKKIKKWIIREEEMPKTSTRKIKRHLVIPEVIEKMKID